MDKLDQWANGAELAAASHGRKGGEFKYEQWANGKIMVTPVAPWATAAHALPVEKFTRLKENGWYLLG